MINFIKILVKKIKFPYIFWSLLYLLILVILINNGASYLDPDFGWHLKVGESIALNQQIPHANVYNYTYTGNWVDHEWLSNLISYQAYTKLGYEFLIVFFALIIVLTIIILHGVTYKKLKNKNSFWLIAALELLGVIASLPHFGVRIQELSLFFVLLLLIIINYYNKKKNWHVLSILPPFFFLWACLHASFLLGLFILLAWSGVKLIEILLKKSKGVEFLDLSESISFKQLSYFFTFTLISIGATFLTPYKLELYSFLSGYKNYAYLSLIKEWLPQSAIPLHFYQLFYLSLGIISILFYLYYCAKDKKGLNIWTIFLTLSFLILAFTSRRNFPLFFISSFGLILEVYSRFFKEVKIAYQNYLKILLIFCLFISIIFQLATLRIIDRPFEQFCAFYPCDAVTFIKKNNQYIDANILNEYTWGGFLTWVMPEKKIFIDGRLPQVEFAGKTFIEEYYNLFTNNKLISDRLTQYKIKLILLKTTDESYIFKDWEKIFFVFKTNTFVGNNRLREYLDKSTDWLVVYQDKTAKIYFYTK
jgi:hypothetical protein